MATSIPAGTPPPPQNRVQRMDAAGNFVPVEDEPQAQTPTDPATEPRGFKVGDAVTLSGHVLEVQSPQGGQTSVKVQTGQGVAWYGGQHLDVADESEPDEIEALREQVAAHQAQGGKDAARIGELEGQVVTLQALTDQRKEQATADKARIKDLEAQVADLQKAQKSASEKTPEAII